MLKFPLEIITPHREVFHEEVEAVSVPTTRGTIQVLGRHEPLFSSLTEGEIRILQGNKEIFLAIGGGFMEVSGNRVVVLVSRAAHAHELNEAEIKQAYQAAKDTLTRKNAEPEMKNARLLLRQSLVELKVLRRLQQRHTHPIYT